MGSGAESAGRLLEEAAEGTALVDRASKGPPGLDPIADGVERREGEVESRGTKALNMHETFPVLSADR
jgi:hypothetical protein